MKKIPNKKRIAMFMILGLLSFLAIVFKSVSNKTGMEKTNLAVMYFDESIKGLSVGSAVVFKGVQVGKVVDIRIITNPKNMEFNIPVYVRLSKDGDFSSEGFYKDIGGRDVWNLLIAKGLRAKLILQNLLSGQLIIELQMLPETSIELKNNLNDGILEIPTVLSTVAGISKDIQDLPIKQIVNRLDNILYVVEKELPQILSNFNAISENLKSYADENSFATKQSFNRINNALQDISSAAKSVKNLTDYIERHPDSFLKGKGQ